MPSWLRVTKTFGTGATLPYLLGAMRVESGTEEQAFDESTSRGELEALLVSMRDDLPPTDCVCIQHCGFVDGYVAAWHAAPPSGRARIQSPYHADRGLYHCGKIYGERITDFDSLLDVLWRRHEEFILQRRFSREWVTSLNGEERDWLRFDQCETDKCDEIRKALAAANIP